MACLNCQSKWEDHTLDGVKECLEFYAERLHATTMLYVKQLNS